MPAALPGTKLTEIQATPEELERVRALRSEANKDKKRSQDTSFKEYIKRHSEQNADVSGLNTADMKDKCMLNFLVIQMRSKAGTKRLKGVHEASTKSSKIAEKHWWNEFQMEQKLGPTVSKHWIESGSLAKKPCPVTGSTLPEHVVFGVPKLWESLTEDDLKLLRLETERDAIAGDAEAVAELSGLSKASIDDAEGAEEEKKKLTPEETLAAFIEDLKSAPSTHVRKYQDRPSNGNAFTGPSQACRNLFKDDPKAFL